MADKCYAPVFTKNNAFVCVFLNIIYAAVILLLIITFVWLTPQGRCLIKQYNYRIQHCRDGNDNPNVPI
jgi:hypothetical protein